MEKAQQKNWKSFKNLDEIPNNTLKDGCLSFCLYVSLMDSLCDCRRTVPCDPEQHGWKPKKTPETI